MHDAGAVFHGHIIVADHEPGFLVRLHKAVKRHVFGAHQIGTGHFGHDLGLLAFQHLFHQGFGHDVGDALVGLHPAVGFMGVDAQGQVAGQGPGGGGPSQKVQVFFSLHGEAHERGLFLYILVTLGHFVRGKRGAAAGAVGHDFMALVDQTLVRDGFQAPPFAFDIIVVVGHIGVFHVHPVADPVAHFLPFVQVLPHAFLALLDEGLDAVLLDLGLAVQAQLLFHFQLYRQAVGIPARFAQHVLPLHGVIPGDQILDGAGLHVADVGLAVGRGRAVEEREGVLRVIPGMEGLFHDVVFLPETDGFQLPCGEIHVGGDFFVQLFPSPFDKKNPSQSFRLGRTDVSARGTTQLGVFCAQLSRPLSQAMRRSFDQGLPGDPARGPLAGLHRTPALWKEDSRARPVHSPNGDIIAILSRFVKPEFFRAYQ